MAKHDKHETETNTDNMPSSADQAPGGDTTPPAPQDGWTGNPDPEAPREHPTEAAAEHGLHSHKGMVKMHKDGQDIHVHPEAVHSHRSAGWYEVE